MVALVALGHAQGRLCGELAAAIARFLTRGDQEAGPGMQGASYYHESEPTLEEATRILKDLGLVRPVPRADKPDETWYCRHALTVDAQAMPDALALAISATDERLLTSFLALACGYDGLSSERTPFTPATEYKAAMRALARAGYAQSVGSAFRWTDQVATAMRQVDAWDEQGRCIASLREQERLAQADAAWRSMPETIRRTHFAKRPMRLVPVVEALTMSWRDGAWHPIDREPPPAPAGQIALARRLIDLAQGRA
ncbi:hypothetical protein [Methylobacterium gnaphalii]|uniref:Uncharacterized protein n=1 Tax=Methylobacterium gnaphalii TaxID=1010610 RepID=A0A512JM90_9HYPH|nr:hypothetical protein [Methylobacterium gnaphalii]GEP11081.1 hypothetical protein MGN01_29260 [Methylobacterium gnaphalii]GJD67104.1 hypothetical protein MMMDOFMJ_0018 [Methylobacterium gnaphalii]GLS50359.1 hypothetical protein GCM10007885_32110 [Methylobacterium gnaphalii]